MCGIIYTKGGCLLLEKTTFKILRLKADLSTEFVAKELGIQIESYRRYERSDRLPPTSKLKKLKEILKCSDDEISAAYAVHTKNKMLGVGIKKKL